MLIVQKYGGSSLATPQHLRAAAKRIADLKRSGMDVVVVASAMGHMTDHLLKLARKTVEIPPPREVDMLLTAGERISMSLLSMALQKEGVPAISFTGSQSGIITSNEHTNARIIDIRPHRIKEELLKGKVVIIAGFQGVSENKEITTLGRGGSDTTAVALAAVLKADKCEILTDVEGLYTADPRIVPEARVLTKLDYAEALEMAGLGAKMHVRSIELAQKYDVPLKISSSKNLDVSIGTQIQKQELVPPSRIEGHRVLSIASKVGFDLFKISVENAELLYSLKCGDLPFRFLQVNGNELNFLFETELSNELCAVFKNADLKFTRIENVSIVSVVYQGLNSNPEFDVKIIKYLSHWKNRYLMLISNSQSISFVVERSNLIELTRFLHSNLIQ